MSQNVLDLHRRFAQALIEIVVAPLVVECWEIDAASKALKKAAVLHLQMQPNRLHKFDIAQHLSKSDRWVYRFLGEADTQNGGESDLEFGPGYRLMRTTLSYLCARHPDWIPLSELARHLESRHFRLEPRGLMGIISVYESIGHLVLDRSDGEGFEQLKVRAAEQLIIGSGNGVAYKRLDRVLDILPRISKGLLAYIDGADHRVDVGSILASLSQGALANLRTGFKDIMRNRVKHAVAESMEDSMNGEDEHKFHATFILLRED